MHETTLIFATFLAPQWYKTYLYMTEYIEAATGIPSFLLNAESIDDFVEGQIDVGILNPLLYLQSCQQAGLTIEPIAIPVPPGYDIDETPAFTQVVVRQDSPVTTFAGLQDCVWAQRASTPYCEDYFVGQDGLDICFKQIIETRSAAQALRSLLQGEADAMSLDSGMLELVLRNSPRMAEQLRVLATCCNVNMPLVVVANHVAPALKSEIQAALACMHEHPFFAERLLEAGIERFLPVSAQYYQNTFTGYTRGQQPAFITRSDNVFQVQAL